MPLTIEVKIEKKEFAVGEDPALTLTLKNEGRTPLRIAKPVAGSGMPVVRLVNRRTGAESEVRPPQGQDASLAVMLLDPGKTHTSFHLLSTLVEVPSPGDFSLIAIYEWDQGTRQAESEPVEFRVTGASVRNLSLDDPTAAYAAAAWVNPATEPPSIVTAEIALEPDGGMQPAIRVAGAELHARPVLSRPPYSTPAVGRWIAWTGKSSLHFVHQHESQGPGKTGTLKLPAPDAQIIPPLAAVAHTDRATRGGGAVLLWSSAGLFGVELNQNGSSPKAVASNAVPFPGPRPQWMRTHVLETTARVFTAVRQEGGRVVLYSGRWPDPDRAVPPPAKRLEWPGTLVGSGAQVGDSDHVRGATLLWMTDPEDGARSLEVLTWTVAPDGTAEDEPMGALDWPESVGIEACILRVRRNGLPALLIRSAKDGWMAIDGLGHQGPLPVPFKDSTLPVDLAFFGEREAVLVAADPSGLVVVKRLDGSDLPPRPR